MGNTKKKVGGGSRLARSETVTVRLDPKLRYLAELAARKHRRTLSSFIEWAIEDALNKVTLGQIRNSRSGEDMTVMDASDLFWDVDEADRFAKLALYYPDLMTHDEQVLWKLIRENGYLWRRRYNDNYGTWSWEVTEHSFLFERLRKTWDDFLLVAKGEDTKEILPKWNKDKSWEEDDG